MRFRVAITPNASRQAKKLTRPVREYLHKEALGLAAEPQAGEQLHGELRDRRSLHCGYRGTQYRIVYFVDTRQKEITVEGIASRGNFYQKMRRLKRRPARRH